MNMSIGNMWNEGIQTMIRYSGIIKNVILLLLAVAFIAVIVKIIAELGDPNKK